MSVYQVNKGINIVIEILRFIRAKKGKCKLKCIKIINNKDNFIEKVGDENNNDLLLNEEMRSMLNVY